MMSDNLGMLHSHSNETEPPKPIFVKLLYGSIFGAIILVAALGNLLVIVAMFRFRRLRETVTNYFVGSLAVVDMLVATLVMPFSASLIVNDRQWIYGTFLCDFFNANDVMFCTASIITLGCISADRYIAILHPFHYPRWVTRGRVWVTLILCWTVSLLISYLPIHTRIYSSAEGLRLMANASDKCEFIVNQAYGIGSSILSFWIPCVIMVITYTRIYMVAKQQRRKLMRRHHKSQKSLPKITATQKPLLTTPEIYQPQSPLPASRASLAESRLEVPTRTASLDSEHGLSVHACQQLQQQPLTTRGHSSSSSSNNTLREHKAAKTLGRVMGLFIACWLPFFSWMTGSNICGSYCPELPLWTVEMLFWIGYFNSTLNPIIYALYNQEFRRAFLHLLGMRQYWLRRKRRRKQPPLPLN